MLYFLTWVPTVHSWRAQFFLCTDIFFFNFECSKIILFQYEGGIINKRIITPISKKNGNVMANTKTNVNKLTAVSKIQHKKLKIEQHKPNKDGQNCSRERKPCHL